LAGAKENRTVGAVDESNSKNVDSGSKSGTVHRAMRLLAALAEAQEDVGVIDLASQLDLPSPTIHRLLNLLRECGMVDWNPKTRKYGTGAEFYRIAAQLLTSNSLMDVIRRELVKLTEITGETILFGMYQASSRSMSFEMRSEGVHALQYRINMHQPLSLVWGASGKAILAHLPDEVVAEVLETERAQKSAEGAALPTLEELQVELERFRSMGYGASEGEKLAGARGIAAPVFGPNGVMGSVCMTSPKERIPINRIAEFGNLVSDKAREISRLVGTRTSG
jgi:DNA-binding IclR family transcriptional regulator